MWSVVFVCIGPVLAELGSFDAASTPVLTGGLGSHAASVVQAAMAKYARTSQGAGGEAAKRLLEPENPFGHTARRDLPVIST